MLSIELCDAITILVIVVILIIGAAIGLHFIWKKQYDKKIMARFNDNPAEIKICIRIEKEDE